MGVLFLDVDGFKQINDRYGHGAGDEFLREVPERLRSALRADDTVARLGGDEFVILLEDCGGEVGALQVAERVLQAFEKPFTLGEETLALRVSMGIAVTETADESADQMLTNADVAMYRAKHAGGDGLALFDTTLRARANERLGLARDLRAAIGTDQLSLHYQPIVDLGTKRVTSVEALVRWDHPVRGQVAARRVRAPGRGDRDHRGAGPLGPGARLHRVRRRAGPGGRPPHRAGREPLAAPAGRPGPARAAARGHGPHRPGPGPRGAGDHRDRADPGVRLPRRPPVGAQAGGRADRAGRLRVGVLLAGPPRRFPIDAIKIDRSFVDGLGTQSRDAAIVGAILPMARALDLEVVAEGVESESKLAHLYALGCRHAQGYLFARPAPMSEIAPLVRQAGSAAADRAAHPELSAHQSRFKAALAAGDAEEAGKTIRAALAAGFDGLAVQAQVIGPALHYIGDEWALGRMGVADEHLATAIAERSLAMVFEAMQAGAAEKRGRVVLAAVEGEHHVLGLRMTSDALSAAGFDVVYLGADVPEDSLLKAVARHSPQAVCLTATVPAGARAIVAAGRRLISRHPDLRVVAGGPAVPTSALRRSGVHVAETVEEAVAMVQQGAHDRGS